MTNVVLSVTYLWGIYFYVKQRFVLNVCSPRSGTSSNASTPSTKKLEDKPSTPISKSITPTSGGSGCSGAAGSSMKPMVKGPSLGKPCAPTTAWWSDPNRSSSPPQQQQQPTNAPLISFAAQYPHYLAGGASPHDLQAAAAAAGAYGALHNNLPPSAALNSYPRPALVS